MNLVFKDKVQKIIAIVIVFALALGMLYIGDTTTFAFEEKKGMITSPNRGIVESKVEPSVNAGKANGLVYGKPVTVIDEVVDATGIKWYKIKYLIQDGAVEKTAYCQETNVLLDEDATIVWTGKINANNVSLWSCTGQYQAPKLATLSIGTKVEILDEHGEWYRVRCEVKPVVKPEIDTEVETETTTQVETETTTQVETETTTQVETETTTQVETETTTQVETETTTQVETEVDTVDETEIVTEVETESEIVEEIVEDTTWMADLDKYKTRLNNL